jgi:hypothetical protein
MPVSCFRNSLVLYEFTHRIVLLRAIPCQRCTRALSRESALDSIIAPGWFALRLRQHPAPAASPRFVQDRFGIGFWVAPQTDVDVEGRYAEIAEGEFHLRHRTLRRSVADARRPTTQVVREVWVESPGDPGGQPSPDLPDSPAVWGYGVIDEPNASQFDDLRKTVDRLRELRPGKLAYINLFPNYASPTQLGTKTYDEHVAKFIAQVRRMSSAWTTTHALVPTWTDATITAGISKS